jgi:chromosome segregation protein
VFLKTLTLKGFKSFADPTHLHLEPGVTVVVGPNGSGKSNVVDAIAWVLGAQAPSSVRSQKMDDVIFAGTAKRPALGRAEVTLTIDNSAGILPIEFTEVSVSRTLFRTGESEYAINGAPCRLLDVQELLSDAGVGRQQHVIVSQGQIDAVLNARPEDRRSIIEEAAGVLKYRKRKEKAERRLDATEGSLLRVQDLLREVRRQLRPLERQAEAARRHGDLVAELSALQVHLVGREIAGLRTRLTALAAERLSNETRDREVRAELAGLDTEVMSAEAELTAQGDTDLSDELMRVEQLRERARGLLAVIAERRRSVERDRGQLMDSGVVANLEADVAALRSELQAVQLELHELQPLGEAVAAEEAAFAEQRQQALPGLEATLPAGPSAASALAEVRGELRSLRASVERALGDQRRLQARRAALAERITAAEADAERFRHLCETAQTAESELVRQLEVAETARIAAEQHHEQAVADRQRVADERSRWEARADALAMALESARARAGAEHLAGVDGVLGTLLDLIEIDAGWEPAVEAALGEALQAVVVASPAAGRAALDSLQRADVHGAVLALGSSTVRAVAPGAGRAVRPHVRARRDGHASVPTAALDELLDGVLGGAVVVAEWPAAVDVALANPAAVVVTERGDRFAPSGWRLGAAGGGATAAALDHARDEHERARQLVAAAEAALDAARAALDAARTAETDVVRRLDAHDATFTANSESLARAQSQRRDAAAELEGLDRTLTELDERLTREQPRLAELDALVPALEIDAEQEATLARRVGETRAQLDAQAALLAARRQDLEVRNAGLLERQAFLERRIDDTERRLTADAEARAGAATRREELQRTLDALTALGATVERRRAQVDTRHAHLSELRRRQSDEVRAVAGRLDGLRRRRAAAEQELDGLRERDRRVEVEAAEVKLRLEGAVEGLRRDHDLEPDAAMAAPLPELPEGTNPAARARELERELRLMGPINPLALEEFTELQERHRFLEEQLEDVRATRRDLMRVIRAVDLEIETVFSAAFTDVAGHFANLFGMLFPGGTGSLVLTQPDDLLNTGIEVEAKPSGKNVKKLSLLSGGERSLTALAFLFAVFRSRPSPFYVMDEVEAALDDVNLHRFLGLLEEFRREAQLLVVSHQKRTMEAGDSLLGVSMQPGGSSRVVVERVASSA